MIDLVLLLKKIILPAAGFYLLFTAAVFFLQDKMIFFRPGISSREIERIRQIHPEAEEVTVKASRGVILHGWLVHSKHVSLRDKPSPLLIYFGGNAEEVSHNIYLQTIFEGWSLLLVNYRGYGLSGGKPEEKTMLEDALLLYDTFSVRNDIDKNRIAVMGRSIGCAPAVYLSAQREIAAAVLVSPFGAIEDIAAAVYPWLPVRLLLRHRYRIIPYASSASNPMLAVAGSADNIIPPAHSEKLFEAWAGTKALKVIPGAGHNDISLFPEFHESIKEFLDYYLYQQESPD